MSNKDRVNLNHFLTLSKKKAKAWKYIWFVYNNEFLLKIYFLLFENFASLQKIMKPFEKFFLFYKYARIAEGQITNIESRKKTVLFPLMMTVNSRKNLYVFAMARFMAKNGYNAKFLVCDSFFTLCHIERLYKTRIEQPSLCLECHRGYQTIEKYIGLKFDYLNQYKESLNTNQLELDLVTGKLCNESSLNSFIYKDAPLGEWALYTTQKFFYIGYTPDSEEFKKKHIEFIKNGITFFDVFEKYIIENKISNAVLHNGSLLYGNIQRFLLSKHQLDYLTYETWGGEGSMIFKANDEVMRLRWTLEYEKFKENFVFSKVSERQVLDLFSGYREGIGLFAKLNEEHVETIVGDYVVLFTNLNFDTAVIGRHTIFSSMIEWIVDTIEFWLKNDFKEKLVIRIHPGELKLPTISTDFVFPQISQYYNISEKVVIYKSDDKVNSYNLLSNAKFSLVYSSTIGLESLLYDVPVMAAGDPFYSDQKFISMPENRDQYFNELINFINGQKNSFDRNELLRYLYYFYIVRPFNTVGLKFYNKTVEPDIQFKDIDEFIAKNSQLIKSSYEELILGYSSILHKK